VLVDQIDELLENQPFQPFRIFTSDGRTVGVRSREFVWHPPASRMIYVASPKGTERVHMIDLFLVTRFTVNPQRRNKGNGHPKRRPAK
jgi:hypothetical protein